MMYVYVIGFHFLCLAVKAYQRIDSHLDALERNFTQFWHSYVVDSGVGNREELYILKVVAETNTELPNNILKWESYQAQGEKIIIGLGQNFLLATSFNSKKNTETFKKEIEGFTKFFSIFQKWEANKQKFQSFIVVATSTHEHQDFLKWYTIHDRQLVFLWDWPVHFNITYLDVVKINHDLKLLIVSHTKHDGTDSAVNLYNFNVFPKLDIWLFERISTDTVPSSLTIFSDYFNTYLAISYQQQGLIDIWIHSKTLCVQNQKHFSLHQKIYSNGVRSITSFRLNFLWHIAVASKNSTIYQIKENFVFRPISHFNFGNRNEWMPVATDTYREDIILLLRSDDKISALMWNGNENFEFIESFTGLVCRNDSECSRKINRASLKDATTFSLNNYQYILIPTEERTPFLIKILVKLRPIPDKISVALHDLLKLKNDIKNRYAIQNEEVKTLTAINDKLSINATENNYLKTFNEFKATTGRNQDTKLNAASLTKNWSDTLVALDIIDSRLKTLKETFDNFTSTALNFSLFANYNDSAENNILPKSIPDEIVFEGKVIIRNLNLSFLNGYDVNDLLKNSYRKDKRQKIRGYKTFKNVSTKHLNFEKINDILACDIVFSDDFWESTSGNTIKGNILWENKLNILNDFSYSPKEVNNQTYILENYKSLFNISKHTFDELSFEELKITKESIVLQSINSKPMILPVHTAPIDIHYLDVVNQARIEMINVFGNLTVHQINGKNFSDIMEEIKLKATKEPKKNVSAKVEGVLRVNSIELEYFNSVPFKSTRDFVKPKWNKFDSLDSIGSYGRSNNFDKKYFKNLNISTDNKRIIVFDDLDINGVLFTESMNNLKWEKINNTLRKSFPFTTIKGVKTFAKSLKLPKLEVKTINNEKLLEKIMTDSDEQTIKFLQKFETLNFGNLFLNGTFINSDSKELNLLPFRSKMKFGGNLTVENGFVVSVENLEVTDSVNNFSLKDLKEIKEKDVLIDGGLNLKNIKASKVVVEGSLNAENLNGANLMNLENLRVSVRRKQSIEKNIFLLNLTLDGNLIVTSLNEYNLASSVNKKEESNLVDRFLQGQIRDVQRLLVQGNITTSKGINNYDLSSLLKNGIYLGENNIVTGNVTFENTVIFKNLNIINTVNGVLLKKLNEDVVLKHSHVFFNGTKTFSTLKVLKGMKTKYLNNHLIQDVTTLMGDHRMKGPITINGNVVIKANVTATGKLNGIAISQLLKSFSTELDSYLSENDLQLMRDSITIKNLYVKGSIQNISFDEFMKNALYKDNCCDITGKKIFTGEVKFMKNLFVDELIDNVNLEKLATDIVLVNKPRKINGSIILMDAIFNSLYVSDYFNSSLINDFDLLDWYDESVPLDREEIINGKIKFEKPLVLGNIEANLINDHIPSAIITLKEKQFIPVLGLFQKLQVTSDVSVGGNVNGYNLPKEYSKSILLLNDQTISKKMIFHKGFIVKGDLNVDKIKGKAIKKLVTLDTEQNIRNNLNFLGRVTIKGNINNLKFINNVNLKNWYERSVFLNRPQEIYGFWDVRGDIKAKAINGNALLNNLNFTNISKEVEKSKMMAIQKKYETDIEYRSSCHELREMSKYLNRRPYLLHQFDITHVLETQSVIESIIPLKVANFDYLIISFLNECYSAMYKWNENNSTFFYQRHINIGPITKWLVSYRNNATYLITSFLYNNALCEENRLPGNIWVFKANSDRYVHLLTGNAFIDIAQENETSEYFYTLEENGFIYQWTIKYDGNVKDVFLLNLGPGNYRFMEFKIFGGLAITNGREIKEIKLINGKIIISHFSLINNNAVALPVNNKALVGVVLKDKIVVYDNIREGKVFSVIQTYRAESVLWLNYGFRKQSFLVVASQHKLIEIFEYKGVSGFVKRMSFQLFSMKLQAISLRLSGKRQLGKFILVVQKNKIVFLKADMLGAFYEGDDLFC